MKNYELSQRIFQVQYEYDVDAFQCSQIAIGKDFWQLMFSRGHKTPFDPEFIEAQQLQNTVPVDKVE